jgi:predicted nucleic acid-binding protein
MSGIALLDTDIIVDIQRGFAPAVAWFAGADTERLALPGLALLELVQHASDRKNAEASKKIVQDLPVLWPDIAHCAWMLEVFDDLHLGYGMGIIDMIIAATALTHNATLLTHNIKHYRQVPGLVIDQPYGK